MTPWSSGEQLLLEEGMRAAAGLGLEGAQVGVAVPPPSSFAWLRAAACVYSPVCTRVGGVLLFCADAEVGACGGCREDAVK